VSKQTFYDASVVASGAGVVFTLAWAATEAPWALWGACASIAAALGLLVGGYIET
jgi:hypothetical protein